MALTVQKKLELAGDLAKVQPLLQRLHLVEKPKKRHGGRNAIFVSGVIAAVLLVLVWVTARRRCRVTDDGAVALDGDLQADLATEDALAQPPADY